MPKKAAVKTAYPPLVNAILDGLSDLKAENATVIDLRELENAVCSFFVIADAQSNTQVNAMGQAVRKQAREQCAERPWHVEGEDNSEWILLDYVSTVVHLFQTPARAFYDLEGLWGDGKVEVIDLEALAKAQADAAREAKKTAATKTSAKAAAAKKEPMVKKLPAASTAATATKAKAAAKPKAAAKTKTLDPAKSVSKK